MQENKEEEILAVEGESNLKLPLRLTSENASVINNEAGKLNVDIAVQEIDSDGVRIVSDEGLSD
jgi:ABC-type transporter Mla MlaB component